jgi:hypothetical protein
MRALALGLHPIALTTLVAPRSPGDSTRESYRARLNDHVRPIMAGQLHNPLYTCVGGCHGPIGA